MDEAKKQTSHTFGPLIRLVKKYVEPQELFIIENEMKIVDLVIDIAHSKNIREISECIYSAMKNREISFKLLSLQPVNTQNTLDSAVEKLIATYDNNMKLCKEPHEKLMCIITLIQDLEQLHPFLDANCRTFCMLLLNYLLISNGFPVAILDDPNRFDAYSKEELFNEVIKGMKNTFILIKDKKLFDVSTSEILAFLNSKESLKPYLRYFQEIVQIEEIGKKQFHQSKPEKT